MCRRTPLCSVVPLTTLGLTQPRFELQQRPAACWRVAPWSRVRSGPLFTSLPVGRACWSPSITLVFTCMPTRGRGDRPLEGAAMKRVICFEWTFIGPLVSDVGAEIGAGASPKSALLASTVCHCVTEAAYGNTDSAFDKQEKKG